jgi:hypothetical protein
MIKGFAAPQVSSYSLLTSAGILLHIRAQAHTVRYTTTAGGRAQWGRSGEWEEGQGGGAGVHVCGSSHTVAEPGFFFDKAIAIFFEKSFFSSVNLTNLC